MTEKRSPVTKSDSVKLFYFFGVTTVLTYDDAPRWTPAEDEVLIRVHVSSVNPFDCAVRAGYVGSYFSYTLPLIPGEDVSGSIEAVWAGIIDISSGDRVHTRSGMYRDGANAEDAFILLSGNGRSDFRTFFIGIDVLIIESCLQEIFNCFLECF